MKRGLALFRRGVVGLGVNSDKDARVRGGVRGDAEGEGGDEGGRVED